MWDAWTVYQSHTRPCGSTSLDNTLLSLGILRPPKPSQPSPTNFVKATSFALSQHWSKWVEETEVSAPMWKILPSRAHQIQPLFVPPIHLVFNGLTCLQRNWRQQHLQSCALATQSEIMNYKASYHQIDCFVKKTFKCEKKTDLYKIMVCIFIAQNFPSHEAITSTPPPLPAWWHSHWDCYRPGKVVPFRELTYPTCGKRKIIGTQLPLKGIC